MPAIVQAVREVSFRVERGTVKALIGPNGAGKTTLFNRVSGHLAPDAGEIRLRGAPIQARPPHRIAALGLSRTCQSIKLFGHMTALENVMVGRHVRSRAGRLSGMLSLPATRREERDIELRALEALELLGAAALAHQEAGSLSYGQQRAVELARALAAEPELLLLDEPAVGLNIRGARTRSVALEVLRYNPETDQEPHFQRYTVDCQEEWVVLDALNHVKETLDPTLSYRWSCHMAVCGSCGMMVNGEPKLACKAFLRDYTGVIRIEPLRHFPVERDLVTVIDDFIAKLARVKPYLIPKETAPGSGEYRQTPAQLKRYKQFTLCINCMLCYAACPEYGLIPNYLGPAAIALAHRWNRDSRDGGRDARQEEIAATEGAWECSFVGACSGSARGQRANFGADGPVVGRAWPASPRDAPGRPAEEGGQWRHRSHSWARPRSRSAPRSTARRRCSRSGAWRFPASPTGASWSWRRSRPGRGASPSSTASRAAPTPPRSSRRG